MYGFSLFIYDFFIFILSNFVFKLFSKPLLCFDIGSFCANCHTHKIACSCKFIKEMVVLFNRIMAKYGLTFISNY